MQSALTESYCRHARRKILVLWGLALATLVLGLATLECLTKPDKYRVMR